MTKFILKFILIQIPVKNIELVKYMVILIKSFALAAILCKSKWQPTRVLRWLMDKLFSPDELRTSTVHGKKEALPPLNIKTMDAILCM